MNTTSTDREPGKHPGIHKILIIGPNGNVGRHLIPQLLERGYTIRALKYQSEVTPREGVEVFEGNTLDADSLKRAVQGVDAVCHLIRGSAGPGDNSCDKWFNCCLRGAVNLLEACREASLKRLILGSADNVFGHTQIRHPGPINERHPKHAADGYYGLFKIAEEEIAKQYHLEHDVPVVITRFPLIWTGDRLGENVGGMVDVERKIIHRKIDVDGKPLVRHDAIVDDIVRGVMLAIENDAAVGDDFIFAGPAAYSSTAFAERLKEKLGYAIEDQPMPWHSWQLDDSKARGILGYKPRHDVLDWVLDRV